MAVTSLRDVQALAVTLVAEAGQRESSLAAGRS